MVDKRIIEYITKQRNAGFPDDTIKGTLERAGWQREDIADAFHFLSSDVKADELVPAPVPTTIKPEPPSNQEPYFQEPSSSSEAENPVKNVNGHKNSVNIWAILGLVFSILPVIGILGLIFSIIGLVQIKKSGQRGKGLAVAGLIIGICNLVILVFLLMVFVPMLAYFGVFDPGRVPSERCQFPAGIDCIDKPSATSDTITIALRNNIGFPIKLDDVSSICSGESLAAVGSSTDYISLINNEVIPNNEIFRIRVTGCDNGGFENRIETEISIIYTNQVTTVQHTSTGEIRAIVS